MRGVSKICIGLSLTLLISLAGVNQNAFADNYTPTLDELNKQGVINPATGKVYPESVYTLVETDIKGDNTIVIPEYNKDNNTLTEKLYNLELKKYDYGHTDVADDRYSFNIDIFDRDITYSIDNSRLESNRIINSTDLALIDNDFYGLSGNLSAGAIYNTGAIDSITGDFIKNTHNTYYSRYGGAIYNSGGEINLITGSFLENDASDGGAIYNNDTINSITGDFIGNYVNGNIKKYISDTANRFDGGLINFNEYNFGFYKIFEKIADIKFNINGRSGENDLAKNNSYYYDLNISKKIGSNLTIEGGKTESNYSTKYDKNSGSNEDYSSKYSTIYLKADYKIKLDDNFIYSNSLENYENKSELSINIPYEYKKFIDINNLELVYKSI